MIKYLNELKLFENKCLGLNNLIIIIGANIKEKHILEFVKKQQNMTIWCISNEVFTRDEFENIKRDLDENEVVLENFTLKYENNVILHQLRFDFNSADEWGKISKSIEQNYILKKIIVDWSTAKFFEDSFNFNSGDIMEIIRKFIDDHNTEFYSPCCFKIVSYDAKFEKGFPSLYNYYIPDSSTYPGKFLITKEEGPYNIVNKNYIDDFNNFIKDYMDNKYKVKYYTKYENQEFKKYPLVRSGDKEIKEYMVIKKIENK